MAEERNLSCNNIDGDDCTSDMVEGLIDAPVVEDAELVAAMRAIEETEAQSLMLGPVTVDSEGKRKFAKWGKLEPIDSDVDIDLFDIEVEYMRRAICLQSRESPITTSKVVVAKNNRPDAAKKLGGMANACSGRIFVTVTGGHFGPITAEYDPERKQGVLVGERWNSRMEVRQWGVHLAPVSGICGQSKNGAQSVVLSGGYQEDEDHGDWFLYSGSGGRDLSGNKRTNKKQSSDQQFIKSNESLKVSCQKGYPVRVVRASKNKRSGYAPEEGYRYDGIYRIERCWRKRGIEGFIICRYLFIRCDNEPAPWRSRGGDLPRPNNLLYVPEVEQEEAFDIVERNESPSWDFDEAESCWKWKKPPPPTTTKPSGLGTKSRTNDQQSDD